MLRSRGKLQEPVEADQQDRLSDRLTCQEVVEADPIRPPSIRLNLDVLIKAAPVSCRRYPRYGAIEVRQIRKGHCQV